MVKILYGIAGQGTGHMLRSSAVIDELLKNHEVHIVTSLGVYNFLKNKYLNVDKIHGFFFDVKENKIKNTTLLKNILPFLKENKKTKKVLEEKIKNFSPDLIISDWEPYTTRLSKKHNLPVIAIDNINTTIRTDATTKTFNPFYQKVHKIGSKIISPYANYFFLTSFFPALPKEKNLEIVDPIFRNKILQAKLKEERGKKYLVYESTKTNKKIIDVLKGIDESFIVYGFNKKGFDKNIEYREFSEDAFIEDLAKSRGVICNGGFNLISEAIYLGKPILCEPMKGFYEQYLNAEKVEELGFGIKTNNFKISDFWDFRVNEEIYRKNLSKVHFSSSKFYEKLENKIKELVKNNRVNH